MAVRSGATTTATLPMDDPLLVTREIEESEHFVFKAWTPPN